METYIGRTLNQNNNEVNTLSRKPLSDTTFGSILSEK